MKNGECRRTKKGVKYCKIAGEGVRFIGKSGKRSRSKFAGKRASRSSSSRRSRSGSMKPNECRTTKNGVEYCYVPGVGVRFQK